MSFERIAKILHVDEVNMMHGPRGVAIYVRIGKSTHSAMVDNEALGVGKRRLEVIAEHLGHLADANTHKVRNRLIKGHVDPATAAAIQADRDTDLRRAFAGRAWFDRPYDGPLQQAQRADPAPAEPPSPLPPAPAQEPDEVMPSRFHAIMAELQSM